MKGKIAAGVVGCGYWGPLLVRNFKNLPDCQLKAVCDVNAARLKHLGGHLRGCFNPSSKKQPLHADGINMFRRVVHYLYTEEQMNVWCE